MSLHSIAARSAFALCLGSLSIEASSACAVDVVTPQLSAGDAPLETPHVPASVEKAFVEEVGSFGVDPRSVKHHLAASLQMDSGLLPRNNSRYSFNGNMLMYVQVARPAIGSPFGSERTLVEFPKMGTVQQVFRRLMANQ